MKLEEVDFEFKSGRHGIKLSELTVADIKQIKKISQAIIKEKIFDCPIKALIAGFQLFVEAHVESNELCESGKHQH